MGYLRVMVVCYFGLLGLSSKRRTVQRRYLETPHLGRVRLQSEPQQHPNLNPKPQTLNLYVPSLHLLLPALHDQITPAAVGAQTQSQKAPKYEP